MRPRAQSQDLRTAATTRSVLRRSEAKPRLLEPGQLIVSPETNLQFRVERLLGRGGFGEVYLSRRLGQSSTVPEHVCIKASSHIDGWLREAYFGQLLDDHPRAIRVFDAFPLVRDNGQFLYCLALEYARFGDLSAFLERDGARWTEAAVRREMAGVLDVLDKLHRGQLLHRDLTPVNVFVCEGRQLKLGDFGIVRQQTSRRGITARTMNTFTAPSEFLAGAAPKWQARDDVYQVGQLLGMLLKGDARTRIGTKDVRGLTCSDHLAFTGILARPRKDAIRAARRAGAIVHGGASAQTTVVVRGRPNALQAAGRDGGLKLMEIKRLRERGHRITLLNESRFWQLVKAPAKKLD